MNQRNQKTVSHEISAEWGKGFSREILQLSQLGFDSVFAGRSHATCRKVHSTDLSGKPHLYTEMEFRKGAVCLRYSCPQGCDERVRRLHACLFLLQVLRLLPSVKARAADLACLFLPTAELSAKIASRPYESLAKECEETSAEASELSARNRSLLRACEESACSCLALEQENAALLERVRALEAVPDAALREMVGEWIVSHRGSFNAAAFSKAFGVPPARCESALAGLLESGAIRRAPSSLYAVGEQREGRFFWAGKEGVASKIRKGASRLAKAARGVISAKR